MSESPPEPPAKRRRSCPSQTATSNVPPSHTATSDIPTSQPFVLPPVPTEPASSTVPTTPHTSPQSVLTPDSRQTLRNVLKTLSLDPRVLTRLSNLTTPPTPPLQPAHHLLRRILHALAPLAHPADPPALTALFEPRARSTPEEKLTANVVAAMKATRRGTLARRYVRSLLCAGMSRIEVNSLLGASERGEKNLADSDDEEDNRDSPDGGLRITGKTFSRARRDWEVLQACGELSASKFGRSKVQDDSLRSMLAFLFAPENVVLSSWGGARIVVEGKVLELPAIMASKNGSILHQEYVKVLESRGETPLSRGSFYAVLNTLTRREVTRVLPVDNATRTLVKDPLTLIRDVVIRMVPYTDCAQFLKEVDKVEWFLTWSFADSHIRPDPLGCHDINFALSNPALLADFQATVERPVDCKGCSFPFAVINEIEQMAELKERGALSDFMEGCQEKFAHYMQYQCRKYAQGMALDNAINEILWKNIHNRVIVFMDYIHSEYVERTGKMHLLPIFRDTGFHGSVVYYLSTDNDAQSPKNVLKSLFYLHLVNTTMTNDPAVISFVTEALIQRIRIDLPLVNEIVFVADNGCIYKDNFVQSFLPHLTRHAGLRTVRMLHTCCQTSEFLIDAVFESATSCVRSKCGDMKSLTPAEMVKIINEESESLNTFAEELDTFETASFVDRLNVLRSRGIAFPDFEGANDISYQDWQCPDDAENDKGFTTVKAQVFQFAGIGNGNALEFDDAAFRSLSESESPMEAQTAVVGANSAPKPTSNGTQDAVALGFSVRSAGDGQNGFGNAADQSLPDRPSGTQGGFKQQPEAAQLDQVQITWKGPVTGIQLLRYGLSAPQPLKGAIPRPGKVSCGLVADTISHIRFSDADKVKREKVEGGVKEETVGATAVKTTILGRSCPDCNRCFKSERFLNAHLCKGRPPDKDISARAIVLADEMFLEGKLPAFAGSSDYLWKDSFLTETTENRTYSKVGYGWALKNANSEIEDNCRQEYKREVFSMLDESKGGESMSAEALNSRLLTMHPNRDDIPDLAVIDGWRELRKAAWRIQPFCQIGIDGTPVLTYDEENENGQGKSRMKNRYAAKITEMHQKQLQLAESERPKPRHMFREFENFFKDEQGRTPPDFPEMKQVMNKINALRSKSKRAEVR